MREDCDQFRIANGTSPVLHCHKDHRSNNKELCSKFNSDLALSVLAHPFRSVFELFHVKTSFKESNKKQR